MTYIVQWVGIGDVVPPDLVEQVCDAAGRNTNKYFGGMADTMEIVEWERPNAGL